MPLRAPAASAGVYCVLLCHSFALLGCSLLPTRSSTSQVHHYARGYVCLLGSGGRPLHDSEQLLMAMWVGFAHCCSTSSGIAIYTVLKEQLQHSACSAPNILRSQIYAWQEAPCSISTAAVSVSCICRQATFLQVAIVPGKPNQCLQMPCTAGLTPAQALLLPPLPLIAKLAVLLQVLICPAPAPMAPKVIRSSSKATKPPSKLSRWRTTLLSGFYLTNILLILAYIPVRVHFLLNMIQQHDDDDYEDPEPASSSIAYTRLHSLEELLKWEMQLFGMVALISFMKTVRGELIARAFVADLFMYAKAAVLTLIWMVDWRLGSWYGLLCLVSWLCLTMPHYTGPHSFQDMSPPELEDAIRAVKGANKLVVLFHTPSSSRCLYLEPQLAQVSLQFTSPSVKFARVDASAWPALAEQHNLSLSPAREQLPSLLLFEQGAEARRLPALNLESGVVYRASFRPRKVAFALNL